MQNTRTPKLADFLEVGETYTMFKPDNSISTILVKDHIVVDRGFTAASIYLIETKSGNCFMVVRKKKNEFLDTTGNAFAFISKGE
jgi:hypothetical protein